MRERVCMRIIACGYVCVLEVKKIGREKYD